MATVDAGLEESSVWRCIWTHHSLQLEIWFFWLRLWNNEKTDARIAADEYKGSAGARIHGQDHARWSRPFSTFVLAPVLILFTENSNPSLLPLLIWTDSLFCHSPRVIHHHHLLSFLISAHLPSSQLPPHNFSSELSVSPLHLPSKTFSFPLTPSVSESWGGFSLWLELRRCSVCASLVSTDRHWENMIKRWWKQNRQKSNRESAWSRQEIHVKVNMNNQKHG